MSVDTSENIVVGVLFLLFFGGMFAPLMKSMLSKGKESAVKK